MEEPAANVERIFYDGDCGVCHWAVSFVATRDRTGETFRFAPLHGETFEREVPKRTADNLPDSLVIQTTGGELLVRSRGAIYVLRRLGGFWALVGRLLWLVPRPLRDLGYDLFARVRKRLARRPEGTCPMVPPELRRRFDP